jgi:hypothetical protein
MSHSISIRVKSVLKDTSCEASEASVPSDRFCLDCICNRMQSPYLHLQRVKNKAIATTAAFIGSNNGIAALHLALRCPLGNGCLMVLEAVCFHDVYPGEQSLIKSAIDGNCNTYIQPKLQEQQQIIPSLKPNDGVKVSKK